MNQLHDRLSAAADDSGTPLRTDLPSLLERAQASRRRRTRTTAGAVLLTSVALVGTAVGVRAVLPSGDQGTDPDRRTPQSVQPATPDAPVPADEIVRRCLPQLAKYAANPMYPGLDDATAGQLALVHPERSYTPGEVVAVQDRGGNANPAMCLLPEKGQEQDPVPFSAFDPSPQRPERLLQLCSENLGAGFTLDPETHEVVPLDEATPDLRGARITAADSNGPVVAAALRLGNEAYSCFLGPVTWDTGVTEVAGSVRSGYTLHQGFTTSGGSNKSIVDETASWYLGAGMLPADAATIELIVGGADAARFPVRDGGYAFVHKDPGPGGLLDTGYRVLDADGKVLHVQVDAPNPA